jgi:hypothetical protein
VVSLRRGVHDEDEDPGRGRPSVPGPNILLSGDVEGNPGPTSPIRQTIISVKTIKQMHAFQVQSIKDREKNARDESPGLHPCIVLIDEDERDNFMEQFYLTNGSGNEHDEVTLESFADLVVSPNVQIPASFLSWIGPRENTKIPTN